MIDDQPVHDRQREESLCAFADAAAPGVEPPADFLRSPVRSVSVRAGLHLAELAEIGRRIGPHRIVEFIGAGGMGAVYRARREDGLFDQEVAIKLIRLEAWSAAAVDRFELERRALAALDHPGITRITDGGTLADGRPYLVMEFVRGLSIDQHCAQQRLDLSARLELMRQICAAVHHAHQHLIVHRDLKPGNMLITPRGELKLLDFGVAGWLAAQGEPEAESGSPPQALMTPRYASPEQIRGHPVTTASDIYSLGVVFYELLTGHRPEPPSPSESPTVASRRSLSPSQAVLRNDPATRTSGFLSDMFDRSWWQILQGDLDAIILTAICEDPRGRYSSAAQLADDLAAAMADRPVSVRRAGRVESARRLVRRHRAACVSLSLVVLALVGAFAAIGTALAQERQSRLLADFNAHKAREHAARADQFAARARKSGDFLRSLLSTPDPVRGLGPDVMLRSLLDNADERIAGEFDADPQMQAELLAVLGRTCNSIGLLAEAESHYAAALELSLRHAGPQSLEAAHAHINLGGVQADRCDLSAASRSFDAAALILRDHPDSGCDLAVAVTSLAGVLSESGQLEQARSMFEHARVLAERRCGLEHQETARAVNGLGAVHHRLGRLREAEQLYREAIGIYQAVGLVEGAEAMAARGNLAKVCHDQGRLDEALAMYESLASSVPAQYFRAARIHLNHVELLIELDHLDEAEATLRSCQVVITAALPPDDCRVLAIGQVREKIEKRRAHLSAK